ncbi:uncharacterized protein LOC130430536 [Triplophysa dalaica]|nr:uncharacterized protein LOC130430536 [Triplophysa dalaica]
MKINSEDSEWKFSVTVSSRLPWEKRPEQKEESTENTPEESKLLTSQDSPIREEEQTENSKTVSLMEGGSLLIRTGDAFTQRPDMIKWMFKHKCIAELTGNTPAAAAAHVDVDKDERFTGRLKLDHYTFTITNTRTTDSGCYTLRMRTGDSKWEYIFNVRVLSKKNKGNFSEAANAKTESDPLWSVHVAQNNKELCVVNVVLKPSNVPVSRPALPARCPVRHSRAGVPSSTPGPVPSGTPGPLQPWSVPAVLQGTRTVPPRTSPVKPSGAPRSGVPPRARTSPPSPYPFGLPPRNSCFAPPPLPCLLFILCHPNPSVIFACLPLIMFSMFCWFLSVTQSVLSC